MSSEESTESRQKYELEALQSIYADELKDLRGKAVWNKWQPINVSISLIPQQGSSGFSEINARIDLHVICSSSYPNSVPKICLENPRGLSDTDLVLLKNELEKIAEDHKGEEVIFALCQHVQEFLHSHNKPSVKSFYDEMVKLHQEKQQKDLQAKMLEEDRQRQTMREEIQRRQEILKSEPRRRKDGRFNSDISSECELDGNRRSSFSNNSSDGLEDCMCTHDPIVIEFTTREIQRAQCIKHSNGNQIAFYGIDQKNGEIVILTEWIITTKNHAELNFTLKQLSSIEQELNYLLKLKHTNLAHYLSIKYEHDADGKVIIYILKEFVNGINCSLFIKQNITFSIQSVREITKKVLNALDYLHRNNVLHRDIKESCIYLTEEGCVKLSNYSLDKRLTDLSSQKTSCSVYNKKTDIYKFGIFLLSILQGQHQSEGDVLNIPNSIPQDLYDFLLKCLNKDEKERYTTQQLLNHKFLSSPNIILSPKHKNEEEVEPERNASPEIAHPLLQTPTNQSRLNVEFEYLSAIGQGAFGDVIKVRNKLDGGYYAIKRIKLNPKNRQLNKKIVREVKLLSRLNHENVVRYYNSWIETAIIKHDDDSEDDSESKTDNVPKKRIDRKAEFTINDNIEALAPPMKNVEISVTYDSKSMRNLPRSEDESSEDEDNWSVYNEDSDSDSDDGIEFEHVGSSLTVADHSSSAPETSSKSKSDDTVKDNTTQIEFMYIQMEFCEKSTLRNAIDNNLYQSEDRVWRLFREIVEGLAHIHQQGMIHRDLKPVNIFLDSDDHVKIGDFGLATTNIKNKVNELVSNQNQIDNNQDIADESKTGLIGTALYVAPELAVASKAIYNQKVDIYSLGIIFFEMCYRPLSTNMERITILQRLRSKQIELPDDFNTQSKQAYIVKWLLNHDTSVRPTSEELLQSEYLPPPVLAECELRELVRHTLSNPQLKAYKYLIASCFNQDLTVAQDITYDNDPSATITLKPLQLYDSIKEITLRIFKQHGGQNLVTPLLMPKSKYYNGIDSCVRLMTHFGGIVSLPHDLRVPFARYVAWNGISYLRRYSIERVYREKKVFGFLPRELYECAFDIVTPTPGVLITDAEILYLVYEIIKELPGVNNKTFLIRLNHTSLITAIFLHFGIKDKHEEMYQLILDAKNGRLPKSQIQTHLISFGLSDSNIATITNLLLSEYEISKAVNALQIITKKKSGDACILAKQALQDLKTIINNAESFGVTFEMVVSPGLTYNANQYSGMICQFVCELKKKHKHENMEVLAAGGRYDSMIDNYRKMLERACNIDKNIKQSAVGISISLDKLVQAVQKEQQNNDVLPHRNFIDVAVCSVGSKAQMKEKIKILTSLWTVGIRSALIETTNLDEIISQCTELKIPHLVMLKDSDKNMVVVSSWERDRFHEKNFKINELVENMVRIVKRRREGSQEMVYSPNPITKSESRTTYSEKYDHEPSVNIYFITVDKISASTRKRYELQIMSQLDSLFKKLAGYVVVLGLTIEANVIKTIAANLEFDSEKQYQKSLATIIERHPRHKKHLNDICDKIYEHKTQKINPAVVLFSITETFSRIII